MDWLKLASNHELYVRVKKFVSSVNSILPKDTPGEREIQSENLNLSMRSFVNEIFIGADIEDCKRELYQRFMFKFLNIMCYDKVYAAHHFHHRFFLVYLVTNRERKIIFSNDVRRWPKSSHLRIWVMTIDIQ